MAHPMKDGHVGADPHIYTEATPVSEHFLNTLVAELDDADTAGIVLGGSYARGDAHRFSDVDFACFVKDEAEPKRKRFLYRDGLLVSISTKTVARVRADMAKPHAAIRVVPGIGNCRVLLDKDGSIAQLMQEVAAFRWEPLQPAADSYVSFGTMSAAEQVHKIVAELATGDEMALSYATSKLFAWLTEAVAVQRGIMVTSDNTYYHQVQEAAGADSAWAQYHTLCASEGSVQARGTAALHLYCETVTLLRPVMRPDHLQIAEQAARLAGEVANRPYSRF